MYKVINQKILNIYLYGSRVYDTHDDESDIDYIFIVDKQKDSEQQVFSDACDITVYPVDYFQHLIDDHKVSPLECLFLPEKYVIGLHEFNFTLDIEKLRRSFSKKSSNSWVKAKKKIDLHGEIRIGKKSLFHSLRILDFGIQIARHGKIMNYSACASWWDKINNLDFNDWNSYKEMWQTTYNELHSEFKKAAPIKKDRK